MLIFFRVVLKFAQNKITALQGQVVGLQGLLDQTTSALFDPSGGELFITKAEHYTACIPEFGNNIDYASSYDTPGMGYGTGFGTLDYFGEFVVDIPAGTKGSFCSINEFDIDGVPDTHRCGVYKEGSQWRAFSFHNGGSDCECVMTCIWLS